MTVPREDPHRLDAFHASLSDPMIGTIDFLNEIMARYPAAISFAPGAPSLAFIKDVDLQSCIAAFLEHAQLTRGLDERRALRLLHEYGPSGGLINGLLAEALKRDGVADLAPEDIVVTVGAQEAIFLALRALFRGPDQLLAVASPCYAGIVGAARLLDIGVVAIREASNGPDLDRLRAEIDRARARGARISAMYVAPDYANPSGTLMDASSRRELLALAASERIFLIEDSAYAFTGPGAGIPALKTSDRDGRVILIGTFAKIGLPGARVGFAAADQRVARPDGGTRPLATLMATLKTMVTVNTSPISQAIVGGLLLHNGRSLAALGRSRASLYRHNLAHLLACLDEYLLPLVEAGLPIGWNRPQGGFFVRLRLPVPVDLALLERSAEHFGVLWTPMRNFHLDDGGDKEMRLSCSYLDSAGIEEGVRRLATFLRSLDR